MGSQSPCAQIECCTSHRVPVAERFKPFFNIQMFASMALRVEYSCFHALFPHIKCICMRSIAFERFRKGFEVILRKIALLDLRKDRIRRQRISRYYCRMTIFVLDRVQYLK